MNLVGGGRPLGEVAVAVVVGVEDDLQKETEKGLAFEVL